MSSEKKLLIIHHGALGDVVLTFPTILCLRGAYNRIDAVCQKKIGDLAHRMGLIDGRIDINASFLATIYSDEPINAPTEHLLQQYDRVILFSFSRSLEDAVKQITGDRMNRIPPRPAVHEKIHVGKYIADLLVANKILETTAVPRDLIEKWRREHGSWFKSADPQKIIIHPGSGSLKKNWPFEYFLQTADFLISRGLKVTFIFGPSEYHLYDVLPKGAASRIRLYMTDDLDGICSLLTSAVFFLGNDSGLSHLAAFMGLSTAAIFGPSDPVRWGPVGRLVKIVTAADTACLPCFEDQRKTLDCIKCLWKLRPETVNEEILELIDQSGF